MTVVEGLGFTRFQVEGLRFNGFRFKGSRPLKKNNIVPRSFQLPYTIILQRF